MPRLKTTFQYSDNWHTKAKLTTYLLPRCVCCMKPAQAVHHMKYRRSIPRRILGLFLLHNPHSSVSGYEIPLWDVIPVCHRHHDNHYGISNNPHSVHYHKIYKQRGGLNNGNTPIFTWRMRTNALIMLFFRWTFFKPAKQYYPKRFR